MAVPLIQSPLFSPADSRQSDLAPRDTISSYISINNNIVETTHQKYLYLSKYIFN